MDLLLSIDKLLIPLELLEIHIRVVQHLFILKLQRFFFYLLFVLLKYLLVPIPDLYLCKVLLFVGRRCKGGVVELNDVRPVK